MDADVRRGKEELFAEVARALDIQADQVTAVIRKTDRDFWVVYSKDNPPETYAVWLWRSDDGLLAPCDDGIEIPFWALVREELHA